MLNNYNIPNRIKSIANEKHIAIGKMLSECELSKNTLSTMQSGGYLPRLETIFKIANYLNISIDYLLGRTSNPQLMVTPPQGEDIKFIDNKENNMNKRVISLHQVCLGLFACLEGYLDESYKKDIEVIKSDLSRRTDISEEQIETFFILAKKYAIIESGAEVYPNYEYEAKYPTYEQYYALCVATGSDLHYTHIAHFLRLLAEEEKIIKRSTEKVSNENSTDKKLNEFIAEQKKINDNLMKAIDSLNAKLIKEEKDEQSLSKEKATS